MFCSFSEIQREDAKIWFRILSSPGLYQTHTMNQDWSTCCFVIVSLFPHVPTSVHTLLCPPCSMCWQGVVCSRDHTIAPWLNDTWHRCVRATEQELPRCPSCHSQCSQRQLHGHQVLTYLIMLKWQLLLYHIIRNWIWCVHASSFTLV